MNRALAFTLLALAVVVVAFVATWLTIPAGRFEQKDLTRGYWPTHRVGFPAKLFRGGLAERAVGACTPTANPLGCLGHSEIVYRRVDLHSLRERVVVIYAALAAVVVLVGLAVGTLRRPTRPPTSEPHAG